MNNNLLSIYISRREKNHCYKCGVAIKRGEYSISELEKGKSLCFNCSPFKNLTFLPSGDAALTRRSKKYSALFSIVQEWNNRRKRYERRGIFVEADAIKLAKAECQADSFERAEKRQKAAVKREKDDIEYIQIFSKNIRLMYPFLPADREMAIAKHACEKYSGRVGRTAAAKEFDEEMIRKAVIAHIRHNETGYDDLFGKGKLKRDIRLEVKPHIEAILRRWQGK